MPSRATSISSTTEDRTPLEQFAVRCFDVLLRLAPSWWLTKALGKDSEDLADTRQNRVIATYYVVFVTATLVALWLISPSDEIARLAFGGITIWRLVEIFTVGLGIVLRQENSLIGYSFVTVAFWGVQVALIFAILDHSFATAAFVLPGTRGGPKVASRPFDYLYISVTQMVTLGNEYDATTDGARALAMAAGATGVLLLAVYVASALTHDRMTIDRRQLAEEVVRIMRACEVTVTKRR